MTADGISLWAIVVLVLFTALPVSCMASAREMPPNDGGIAGWLRWYAGSYAFYAVFFLSTSVGGDLPAIICALITLPFAAAVWIKSPRARDFNAYGNFGLALFCLPHAASGAPQLWILVASCLFWGTYFLRSERVRVTYGLPA